MSHFELSPTQELQKIWMPGYFVLKLIESKIKICFMCCSESGLIDLFTNRAVNCGFRHEVLPPLGKTQTF